MLLNKREVRIGKILVELYFSAGKKGKKDFYSTKKKQQQQKKLLYNETEKQFAEISSWAAHLSDPYCKIQTAKGKIRILLFKADQFSHIIYSVVPN